MNPEQFADLLEMLRRISSSLGYITMWLFVLVVVTFCTGPST